jgi:Uma2 family endonuclease
MSALTRTITTVDQLLDAGDIGRCELVRGELHMMSPAGADHGGVATEILLQIATFVKKHKLGRVYAAETGFVLSRNPDSVRAPDVAFVRADRVPKGWRRGFFEGAPDFAVEVLSPDDRAEEVFEKLQDWFAAGCRLIWVVNPKSLTVVMHHPDGRSESLRGDDAITGGDVLPGFSSSIFSFFEL